jgi:hypothetical protein
MDCAFHAWVYKRPEPPADPGRYRATPDPAGGWRFTLLEPATTRADTSLGTVGGEG